MLLFIAAAALAGAAQDPATRAAPARQARATVVIVRGERVGSSLPLPKDSIKRTSVVRDRDGSAQQLPLIEFF